MHSELLRQTELTSKLMSSDDQGRSIGDQKIYMTKEMDLARRELRRFRKDLDGLSEQLSDMTTDMVRVFYIVSIYCVVHFLVVLAKASMKINGSTN